MPNSISPRIARFVAALPLRADMHILEIGCGPGVAARLIARSLTSGRILGIDRSRKAIELARAGSLQELESGRLAFRLAAIEQFALEPGGKPFDLAFAMRVGALDGRHPELEAMALMRIKAALKPDGLLVIDDRPALVGRDLPGFP